MNYTLPGRFASQAATDDNEKIETIPSIQQQSVHMCKKGFLGCHHLHLNLIGHIFNGLEHKFRLDLYIGYMYSDM